MYVVMQNVMIFFMNTERLTISLPKKSLAFISRYKGKKKIKSNSQVVLEALELLEQQALYEVFSDMGQGKSSKATVKASQQAAEGFLDESW
jgi:Arc/MetJ-type ribon-helix-helix transcriptional regulator